MVIDAIILLLLGALLLLSVYQINQLTESRDQQKNRYIDALERQIRENNQDISRLSKELADSRELPPIRRLSNRRPIDERQSSLKPSSQDDLLKQLSIFESKLAERNRQIALLQNEISRYQHQKRLLIQRDEEINTLSAELAQSNARLNDALSRLKNSKLNKPDN